MRAALPTSPTAVRISRPFLFALIVISIALFLAAFVYWRERGEPTWIFSAALPACLLEAGFYLAATVESERKRWFGPGPSPLRAAALWLTALLPYLIFGIAAHTFSWRPFGLLAFLTAIFSFWNVIAPRRLTYDVGFLVIAALPQITHVFKRIYLAPDPQLDADVLGHLMWIHVGIVSLLSFREWDPGPFGLWPKRAEWSRGVLHALWALPVLGAVAWLLHDFDFAIPSRPPTFAVAQTTATFFGMLWVVALSEELFFRGFIQCALQRRMHSLVLSVALASIVFGAAHFWTHRFPNWRQAIITTVLGLACGIAYAQTRSVRASMVTHAMIATAGRLFFHLQ